jgi:hypothetical protein
MTVCEKSDAPKLRPLIVTDAALLTALFSCHALAGEYTMNDAVGASKENAFINVAATCWIVIPIVKPVPTAVLLDLQLTVVPDDQAVVVQISAS